MNIVGCIICIDMHQMQHSVTNIMSVMLIPKFGKPKRSIYFIASNQNVQRKTSP